MVKVAGHDRVGEGGPRFFKDLSLPIPSGNVCEKQLVNACIPCHSGCLSGRYVTKAPGKIGIPLQVRGFDDQDIGIAQDLGQACSPTNVAHVSQTGPLPFWSQNVIGLNHAPIL
jgi:hypothetical protein